jgi:predicted transcriptional regulator
VEAVSISIELRPEVEKRLNQEATAKGVSVEAFVEDLIEQQVARPHEAPRVDMEELDRVLDALPEGSEDRPAPPPEAYTRESIYQEHD